MTSFVATYQRKRTEGGHRWLLSGGDDCEYRRVERLQPRRPPAGPGPSECRSFGSQEQLGARRRRRWGGGV